MKCFCRNCLVLTVMCQGFEAITVSVNATEWKACSNKTFWVKSEMWPVSKQTTDASILTRWQDQRHWYCDKFISNLHPGIDALTVTQCVYWSSAQFVSKHTHTSLSPTLLNLRCTLPENLDGVHRGYKDTHAFIGSSVIIPLHASSEHKYPWCFHRQFGEYSWPYIMGAHIPILFHKNPSWIMIWITLYHAHTLVLHCFLWLCMPMSGGRNAQWRFEWHSL